MAVQTGRTVGKFCKFQIADSGATIRDIPVTSINGVGLQYDETDVSAIQDTVRGYLNGQADFSLEISGPFDTSAAQAASGSGASAATSLSGSHTVLNDLPNDLTPLAFGIYFGVRHDWETGEPVFGVSDDTSGNGILCMSYNVNPADMTYTATFRLYPGSTAPSWGTAAIT